jgi:membrane fusion protein (multidrug efflux system)
MKILLGPALCLVAFISCSDKEPPKNRSARVPTVTVTQPREEKMERIISTVGTLELEDDVQVATEVSGLIKEVRFKEGQEVNPGDALVVLDPANFQLNLDKAKTALDKAKSNLGLAEENYKRNKTLREKELISEQEYQELATVFENAKSDLAAAQTNLQIAQRALDYSTIRAPIDQNNQTKYNWEVQKKLVSIGEYLTAGSPVAELVNRTTLKLRFTVPEREAGYLAPDKAVRFTVPALPGKEFEARIFYIGPNAVESTRSVIVKAYVDNAERILRAGYSADVRFIAQTKAKALVIPRRSLRFDVDKAYVLLVTDGVLHKKDVTLGVERDDFVEIISGIGPADTIVVRSGSFLEEGTKVEIVEDK